MTTAPEKVQVVTQEDLAKSLQALEGKQPEAAAAPKTEVKVAAEPSKTVTVVREKGSEHLKKAIEVSDILAEFVGLLGSHNDEALETLAKSLNDAAERDYGVVRVLEGLKKSIDENTATLKELMKKPDLPAAARLAGDGSAKILPLNKTLDGGDPNAGKNDPVAMRKSIIVGLEKLAKAHPAGSPESQAWIKKTLQFESAGKLSNEDMASALAASKK